MTHGEKDILRRSLSNDWETPEFDDFLNAKKVRLPGFSPNAEYWASGTGCNEGNALSVRAGDLHHYVWNCNTTKLCVRFVRREVVGKLRK